MDFSVFRFGVACLLAPAVPSVLFVILHFFTGDSSIGRYDLKYIILFSLPISYLAFLFLGLPVVWYLNKVGYLSIITLSLASIILGIGVLYLFGFMVSGLLGSTKSMIPSFIELLIGTSLGLLISSAFGFIMGIPIFNYRL